MVDSLANGSAVIVLPVWFRLCRLRMARFDVYANPIADQRREVPYWIDVQFLFQGI
jgi:hypothetical protein